MCLAVCESGPRLVAPETGEPPVRSFNCAANMLFSISSCRILLALLSDFGDDDADQTGEREGDRVGLEALLFLTILKSEMKPNIMKRESRLESLTD